MYSQHKILTGSLVCLFLAFTQLSCRKLISVQGPKDTITTTQVFNSIAQTEGALAGVYTRMINSDRPNVIVAGENTWSAGAIRLLAGLSSGELYNRIGPLNMEYYVFSTNNLTVSNNQGTINIWKSAYASIYGANAIIEGIAASTSSGLTADARKELTGEAKFIRAFALFYLTNLYGDIPLPLTSDFRKTVNLLRAPQEKVYAQIVEDLKEAQAAMRSDYSIANGERVRPNKWAATALLARVYLYSKDYKNAATAATAVINEQGLYNLESDLNKSFQMDSREAIWQLKPFSEHNSLKNATPEGYLSIPSPRFTGGVAYCLSDQLMNAFEPGDKRRIDWVDSSILNSIKNFYPTKYKIGVPNSTFGAPGEYYLMLRFSEMFLIRAEAFASDAGGNLEAAIDDLNIIRNRAGLPSLANTLTRQELIAAVEQERQVELFAEWGHRWFDLRRTGRASDVLQTIPLKLPWKGDFQLLYPIPFTEIRDNPFLTQNPGYF